MRRETLLKRFTALQSELSKLGQALAQDGASYRANTFDPSSVDFTSDDWDGSEAEASYPNPSDDDADADDLAANYLLVPEGDAASAKSNYKLPIRDGDDGPVNTNALTSAIAAINGARGGVEGVSRDDLQAAFDQAVDLLIEAGVYEDQDDAPAFEPANAADQNVDDVDPDADIDDQDASAGADAGGQDDDVFADVALEASVTGTVQIDADQDTDDVLTAADGDGDHDGLVGIIWGAGNHDLHLGGEGAAVHVPEDSIDPTFQALQKDVAAGDVEIGLDHADDDSVLAQSGLREIGIAEDVAMAADGKNIVLTESRFTNDQALEAHEAGDFDSFDFSVVGDVAIRTDDDGNRVTTDDGRVVLDATRITRIDVVQEGAVDAASVGRVPELQSGLATVQDAVQNPNQTSVQDAAQALHASASALDDLSKTDMDIDPDDIDDIDAARDQLSAAADIIDDQTDKIDSLEAQADAFGEVAQAHDVDPDDFDDVEAAAQAVVDAQTEDIRADIADIEAELPSHDTGTDDGPSVEARADDLSGKSKAELQNLLNARKADKLDVVQAQQNKGKAAAQSDQRSGRNAQLSGGDASGGSADADEIALEAMGGRDRIEQQASDQSPAAFIRDKYGVEASDYADAGAVNDAIIDATQGDA